MLTRLLAGLRKREPADVADVEAAGLPRESIADSVAPCARGRDSEEKPAQDSVVILGLPASNRSFATLLSVRCCLGIPGPYESV
jgi:hypothetical protein